MAARLSHQKPMLEASPENSSEDLVANDLSENDVADDDDDDVDGCDNWLTVTQKPVCKLYKKVHLAGQESYVI